MLCGLSSTPQKIEMLSYTRRPHDLFHHSPPKSCRRLVGKLSHLGPGIKLKKLDPPKGLGEQVRKLIVGADVARIDASFCQTVTDEVIPHLDVLAQFIEHRVLGQRRADWLSTRSSTAPTSLPRRSPSRRASQSV
jgi:hypothetical protein